MTHFGERGSRATGRSVQQQESDSKAQSPLAFQNVENPIVSLQRSVGNQAVLRLLEARGIQVKASPSRRGAPAEQDVEADAAKFARQFRKCFNRVQQEFPKDDKELYALFSSWQRAQLTKYFSDKTIPDSLFTSPQASQKIDPGRRIILAAQIVAEGKRDVSDPSTLALRGGRWGKDPRVRALMCGHWAKLVWNYAGVNPGALNTRQDIIGPTGRISFGGGGTRQDLLPMGWVRPPKGLKRHGAHKKAWTKGKITAVFDHGKPLREQLLDIGERLANEELQKADKARKIAKARCTTHAKLNQAMKRRLWELQTLRQRKRISWKEYLSRRKVLQGPYESSWILSRSGCANLTRASNRLKKAGYYVRMVGSLKNKPRRSRDRGMAVLSELGVGKDKAFGGLYRQLSPGKRNKVDKDWGRRPIMGLSMFTEGNFRRGDHLWCYDANRSIDGGHSVIFVSWLGRKRSKGRGKNAVHYRKAALYSQLRPKEGGRYHTRFLGYPFTIAEGRRVYPVTAVFRPTKGKRGGPGPPRTMGELLHFNLHRANVKNLNTLAAMRQGKGSPEIIDLGRLADFLRRKATELLKDPNLTALEPAQRKLCQQIVTTQSGATIDNISNLVALCQKLLNPISFAKDMRGKRLTVNGVLSWAQLGLETPAKRKPLEQSGRAETSGSAVASGVGLGREFELDLAVEYNRSLMNKEGIPSGKLRDLGRLIARCRRLRGLPRRTRRLRRSQARLDVVKDYYKKHTGSGFKGLESLSILVAVWQALRGRSATGKIRRYSDIVASGDLKALRTGTPRR